MTREFDFPAPKRETSELQTRINGIAQLEKLEKTGAHTHSITTSLDPTKDKILSVEAHELREHERE
jgi:hypothetical protein